MAYLLAAPFNYFADANGAPLAGGKVYTYAAGTTTPQASYTDYTGVTPLANPVILDSAGRTTIWLSGSYKIVVKDSLDNTISTTDNISATTATATELNYLSGVTPGTATASKAVVLDSSKNVTGLATNTFNISSTGIANMAAVQGSMTGGFVNKFRNPNFNIVQRGTSGSVTTGNTSYTLDGWLISATGATASWSQIYNQGPSGILSITGAVSMTNTFLKQRIESKDAAPLAGKVCTVQFNITNTTGGSITPTLTVKHPTAADNWGATVTDVSAVSLQAVPNNSVATIVAYTFTAAANSYLGLEVTLDFGAGLNTATSIFIKDTDLRATPGVTVGLNSTPPAIEYRPVEVELAYCQRYYTTTFGNGNTPAQSFGLVGALGSQAYGATAGMLFIQWNYPVQMRAAATITTYNPSAANANWRNLNAAADVVVLVNPDASTGSSGVLIGSQTTALTAGHRCYIHAAATAEL